MATRSATTVALSGHQNDTFGGTVTVWLWPKAVPHYRSRISTPRKAHFRPVTRARVVNSGRSTTGYALRSIP